MTLTAEQIDWAAVSRDFASRFKSAEEAKRAVLEPWLPLIPPTCVLTPQGEIEPKLSKYLPDTHRNPFPQQIQFLRLAEQDVFYGGAAGGGKSIALLIAAAQFLEVPGYTALVLRRTYAELSLPGALMDVANSWWPQYRRKDGKEYWFPTENNNQPARLVFGFLETSKDLDRYQSSEFHYIGIDEVTEFAEADFAFMWSRLRNPPKGVPLRMRCASNPNGIGRLWVKKRYVDKSTRGERIFVPSLAKDNPYLREREQYEENLATQLGPVRAAQLLRGDWEIQANGMFARHWFKIIDVAPSQMRFCRYWDLAACLVAGTMIETNRGHVRIEQVKVGDLVMTQNGYRHVKRSCLSNYVNELVTVVFSDGSHLTGTSNHPVYVDGGYWIGLGDLIHSDQIFHRSEMSCQTSETQILRKDIFRDAATCASRGGITSTATNGTREKRSIFITPCIEKSGNRSMGRFPLATIFTTKTRILTTTKLIISSASPKAIIVNTIGDLQNIEKQCGERFTATLKSFVQEHWRLTEHQGAVNVQPVDVNSYRRAIMLGFASGGIVSQNVFVSGKGQGVPVYDLTVEDAHAFFANGILVHNTEQTDENDPDYTVGALVGQYGKDFVIADIRRARLTSKGVEDLILQTARTDRTTYGNVVVRMEQEPGASGVRVIDDYTRLLAGYDFRGDRVTGPKEIRACALAAQAERGNVCMMSGHWNKDALDEFEVFPGGGHDDIVDACTGAFNELTGVPPVNTRGIFMVGERLRPDW